MTQFVEVPSVRAGSRRELVSMKRRIGLRTLACASLASAAALALAGVFAVIVPAAAGQFGTGCDFPTNLQSDQALELTSTTAGSVAAVVLTDGQLARCFSGADDIGYRQIPFQIELVKRSGGATGLQTVDSELSQLHCLEENNLCSSLSEGIGAISNVACSSLVDLPGTQPEDTVAATTFTLDETLVATVQATKAVHACNGGNGNVYLIHEVVQE